MSVDPLQFEYPQLTPFNYAGNKPVTHIDIDGMQSTGDYINNNWGGQIFTGFGNGTGSKPNNSQATGSNSTTNSNNSNLNCPLIPKFNSHQGNASDYVAAIDNGVIDILNIIPIIWNSGVYSVNNISNGTFWSTVGSELTQVGTTVKNLSVNSWNYTISTPVDEQLISSFKQAVSPQAVEFYSSLLFGSKIPAGFGSKANTFNPIKFSGSKANLSNPFATESAFVKTTSGVAAKSTTTVYRNFGWSEYNALKANNMKFAIKEGGFGSKQFWLDTKGVNWWESTSFSKNFTAKITVNKSALQYGTSFEDLGIYRVISFDSQKALDIFNKSAKIEWLKYK